MDASQTAETRGPYPPAMLDETPPPRTSADPGPPALPSPRATRTILAPDRRRAAFFLHEPAASARAARLRAGFIADGTTRGGPNGIAQGASRVIACAERCAARGDVELVAVFILSPKNLMRRKRPFFATLHAEFLRLLAGVASGRLLAGIRVEIVGRLDRLRRKGGAAARLADVAELLEETTRALPAPRMRLALCFDYEESAPIALGLDVLVRTGMEGPSVMRLSGLRVRHDTVCIPSVKLWRDFTPADLDAALAAAPPGSGARLAPGHSCEFVERLLEELSRAELGRGIRITVPITGTLEEVSAMLGRAALGPLGRSGGVAVTLPRGWQRSSRGVGPRSARVQVELVRTDVAGVPPAGAAIAWIVAGQGPGELRLLERSVGDANVFPCDRTPEAVMDALRRALEFHEEHPPLHGAPRDTGERARPPADGVEPDTRSLGEAFAARSLAEAMSSGLVSGEVGWERQALGYGLTAFAIGFSPPGGDGSEPTWERKTGQLAQVMLALAASDEEISDRVFAGESEGQRRARLRASVDFLVGVVEGERRGAPSVAGGRVLESIARTWTAFFERGARRADGAIVAGVRRAAAALYRANLAELSAEDGLFDALSRRPSTRAVESLIAEHAPDAPELVARRIRDLLNTACADPQGETPEVWREIRLLCRLVRVAPSIGAGCALLAMTATEPAEGVPSGAAGTLVRTASLIDCYFRLVNDLAFHELGRGDRDRKPTTFTCLVPASPGGKARERACVAALQTCLGTASWLREEIQRSLAALWQIWPVAARWWQRGVHFGGRVYERGHYDRLTREAVTAILAELDALAHGALPIDRQTPR